MPLGDSLTAGLHNAEGGGYRTKLETLLEARGLDFTFVGTLSNGPSELSRQRHEGHSGQDMSFMTTNYRDYATSQAPDLVILIAGTAQIILGGGATAGADLATLLDRIRSVSPQIRVLVAQIPAIDHATEADVPTFNATIPATVAARSSWCSIVDLYTGFDPDTMTTDGVHPTTPAGYDWMADRIDIALAPMFAGLPIRPPETPLARRNKPSDGRRSRRNR